jgi:hypothetical protein
MNQLPIMSYAERQARNEAKRLLILHFLASGEVYTTVQIAALVMACSTTSAERTLAGLVRDGALKSEAHFIQSRKLKIYGVTPHGIALAGEFENQPFELGRVNSAYIPHHLQTHIARMNAEAAGWADWKPGKVLHRLGLKKVPDALVVSPTGKRVAIELERHVKTKKRYAEIISSHLQSITKEHWDEVHYLCQSELVLPLQRLFQKIETIPVLGERHRLEEKHRARFKFAALSDWPHSIGENTNGKA